MKIISDPTRDTRTAKPDPGSYEWWYFDALSESGEFGLVVIFYEGNPFSSRYRDSMSTLAWETPEPARSFPALSISIYRHGRPVYYGFQEVEPEDADFQTDEIRGHVGRSSFQAIQAENRPEYRVILDQALVNGDRISGELTFQSELPPLAEFPGPGRAGPESERSLTGSPDGTGHLWNLVQPCASVSGDLELTGFKPLSVRFSGIGYHDHNLGREPMERSFLDWYWGRFHLPGRTFVYYVMNLLNGGRQHCSWMVDQRGRVTPAGTEVTLSDKETSLFGLQSARKLTFTGDGVRATVQQEKVLDNGPFYQRFLSSVLAEDGEQVFGGKGVSEYIMPGRIHMPIFRPLVNMRIAYPGKKGHWVQKSPRLYRWTW
ncbi:MAG: hypothetical protein WD355_01345 [Balneolaceae bacterium]